MNDETKKLLDEINDSIAMGSCALWFIGIVLFVTCTILIISLY